MDDFGSEHYKYADERFDVLFSLLCNSIVVHDHVPTQLMDSITSFKGYQR